jgi:limonene-1,2-epoxide hydrolase
MVEMQEAQEAVSLVKRFLEALERRDLEAAVSMLAPEAKIVFPGAQSFKNLGELVAFARQRYQWIGKTLEQIESLNTAEGGVVVYVIGKLHGLNRHGFEFSGVRFIDRFVVKNGLIISQEVWNDLAETGVLNWQGEANGFPFA